MANPTLDREPIMKEMPLTRGMIAIVDDADFERAVRFRWYAMLNRQNGKWYAARRAGPASCRTTVLLHRFILGLSSARTPQVDHIDFDGLNCQRQNLRIANNAQNNQHKGPRRDNRSGLIGVDFIKRLKSYRARIQVNGHEIHLGCFATADEAAAARNAAAIQHHGEFAVLTRPSTI